MISLFVCAASILSAPPAVPSRTTARCRVLAFADAPDDEQQPPVLETLPSGLRFVETEPGRGPLPAAGDVVTVSYAGELLSDGRKVEFPTATDSTLKFVRGAATIKLWDALVEDMRIGGRRRVLVPPSAEFQPRQTSSSGAIDEGETIRFDLDLIGVETGLAAWPTKLEADLRVRARRRGVTPVGLLFLLSLLPYLLPDELKPGLWKGGPDDGLVALVKQALAPPAAFDDAGNFEDIGF
mmetsp:Transcript_4293/g.9813  ORF Transcript_4293/g.9813 Transcript_4293/m.9813 type:complete len:239 (-) Transcript_4293:135-851(-)